jgi:plasmid stabilization system protein ParE
MIRFCKEAADEIDEAIDWYLSKSTGAAERFSRAISNVLVQIEADPGKFSRLHRDFQYGRVIGFPYICIFRLNAIDIQVLAIAHTSRRERYWIDRQ